MTDSTQEAKSDNTITISLEDFKIIKSFYPEFERAKGIESNDFIIDWNGLMPLVAKIENTRFNEISFNVEISKSFCEIAWTVRPTGKNPPKPIKFTSDDGFGRYSKIETVYKAVVEFIKWHRDNGK